MRDKAMQSEPKRITESHLIPIQEQLIAFEPIFHHSELGTTREVYENVRPQCFGKPQVLDIDTVERLLPRHNWGVITSLTKNDGKLVTFIAKK